MTLFPAENFPTGNQLRLLVAHGLDMRFGAQWVSIEDGHEVARRLLGVGRITGRFPDQDWVSSEGLLCVIP
ncbi:hypothetical protein [Planobispora takensis]|uniref:Uncharacterized protein n=1 Tax=Planobispora takensis TaxID=1367882 RepID=A0A8J3T104_9ACTN|nr:hypothetical protein Pta02_50950 [Planobispora takensis]